MSNISPQHHPDKNLLIEFASGTIDHGQAIAVSSHLHYCVRCRTDVANLERIGGAMMNTAMDSDTASNDAPPAASFDQLMQKINKLDETTTIHSNEPKAPKQYAALPKVIRKMLYQAPKWKRITTSLSSANLIAGQNKYGISLQKIDAGGSVPQHDHRATEITVVLKGSFSDEDHVYQQGDFLLKNAGDIHRPMASSNEDCLCLAVEQAPVKLTGVFNRLLNPFLRISTL
jgi:putative transcriptional regulator